MSRVARPYQAQCIENVEKAFELHCAVMAVLPTGTGKSFIFSQLMSRFRPKRSLILSHRGELVFQGARQAEYTGMDIAIEKADFIASAGLFNRADGVSASIQTMVSKNGDKQRMHKWKPTDFGLIVADECHHFNAKTFKSVIDYFRNGNPEIKIFGCTATPMRSDERALGMVFEHCAYRYEILSAIEDGWLVPVKTLGLHVDDLDFSHIKTSDGDLNQAALGALLMQEKPMHKIAQGVLEAVFSLEPNTLHGIPVEEWESYLTGHDTAPRSTLCFTPTVAHAKALTEIFNRVVFGIAEWICGKTREEDRNTTNERFKSGRIPILVNCGTHTEGVDVPRAEIIVPKPTKSHSLLIQMIGRGFRPAEVGGKSIVDQYPSADERKAAIVKSRKPMCLVLDFYGVNGRHKLVTPSDVLGGKYPEEVRELARENARAKMRPVDMTEEMKAAEKQLRIRAEEERRREAAKAKKVVGRVKYKVTSIDPFDNTSAAPVKMVAKIPRTGSELSQRQKWRLSSSIGIDPNATPLWKCLKLLGDYFKNQPKKVNL